MPRADNAASTREAILAAALDLLADEGYAGASLRKVAARVGIAQPSLYHHFATKEVLVEQVIAAGAGRMFGGVDPDDFPATLQAIPGAIVRSIKRLYSRPEHPKFVRVAFAVARLNPRYEQLMKTIFIEQATVGMRLFVKPFVDAGEIEDEPALHIVRMLVNAAGLRMIEYKVLFGHDVGDGELQRFLDFVEEAGVKLIDAYRLG